MEQTRARAQWNGTRTRIIEFNRQDRQEDFEGWAPPCCWIFLAQRRSVAELDVLDFNAKSAKAYAKSAKA